MARPGLLNLGTWHRESTSYTDHSYREQAVPRISVKLVRSGLQFTWTVQGNDWTFMVDSGWNYFRLDNSGCLTLIHCPHTGLSIDWYVATDYWKFSVKCDGSSNGKIPQSAYIDRIIKSINNRSDMQEAYKIFLSL